MPLRMRLQIVSTLLLATATVSWAAHRPSSHWMEFALFLVAVLVSTGFKVALPRGDGTMSLNFPFILLAIVQLSPLQLLLLSAISVIAQCRVRVKKIFSFIQIVFNVANTMLAATAAYLTYTFLMRQGVALASALSIASISYFFWSTTTVASIIAASSKERTFKLWKSEFPWYLPFYMVGAVLAAAAHWTTVHYGWANFVLLVPMVYTVYRAYTAQIARMKEREQHLAETEALHMRTIEALAMAIEAKDQNTHDHLFRVRNYVQEVAKAMNLSTDEIKALHTAAFLHDIGKLAVPEHIINKPGKLTPEEFEKIKIHPGVGADILDRVRFPYPVVPIVRSHHEWWNGAGYPDGLKGEDIPIGARILTVVDCFDALVSDRPYRKAIPGDEAFAIVQKEAGTQFDPAVVKVFGELYTKFEKPAEIAAANSFSALNTEVEVERGLAPGAGFAIEYNPAAVAPTADSAATLDMLALATAEAEAIGDMTRSFGSKLHINEELTVIAARMRRIIGFDSAALYVVRAEELILQFIDGANTCSFSSEPIQFGQGISGWVAQSGKPIVNGNACVEPNYHSRNRRSDDLHAALSIPLRLVDDHIFAVLTLYSAREDSFHRDHLRALEVMAPELALAITDGLHRTPQAPSATPTSPAHTADSPFQTALEYLTA